MHRRLWLDILIDSIIVVIGGMGLGYGLMKLCYWLWPIICN